MDQVTILRRLADKWREAANEVEVPALRRCYVERAATYERLAAREHQSSGRPATDPRDS